MKGNVIIVGLGLIGGSIALSIKEQHPDAHIIGIDVSYRTLEVGLSRGIIDEIGESLLIEAKRADLLIFCCPVKETEELIGHLAKLKLKPELIVTDTGSTKAEIMQCAKVLSDRGITFIGGHPMAGSHKSGVEAAKRLLFENAYYLFTPQKTERKARVEKLKQWLLGTNAKFLVLSPEEHDEITGMLSHLPHVVAAALVRQTEDFTKVHPAAFQLAAGGFRDITRIASSDPRMWTDISISNKAVLADQLRNWRAAMDEALTLIEMGEKEALYSFFDEAKEFRDTLPVHRGAIPAFYDLFVDVPDYSGVISEVTGYLAKWEISLTNLKILETREDIFGVLQISFQTADDRKRAKTCIEEQSGYLCYYEE
ncbi:prephenate dehydrogenase [Listeria floridensis FSL S10-1187]|uniref:Prephenate dehydrogenase n=1 Tax=Listeria floridensis FSL S10-1187 TaxID=1265817 RepID=A0ABP3B0F5_9LIST|nr:prephenate dehydrogenase [Listeria floridensis]EUJ32932.1 prephenate dehydrogenase [Listeria floridensis FSL S10-1187]